MRGLVLEKKTDEVFFNSVSEEKKVLQHFINIIDSWIFERYPDIVFNLAAGIIGKKTIKKIIIQVYPETTSCKNLTDIIELINEKNLGEFIINSIVPIIKKRLERIIPPNNEEFITRCLNIKKTFHLTDEEMEIIIFFYLVFSYEFLEENLIRSQINFAYFTTFKNFGNIVIGLDREKFMSAFSKNSLFDSLLLYINLDRNIIISQWATQYLSGYLKIDISTEFFNTTNDTDLDITDFDIPEDEFLVLKTLMESSRACNILFYGPTGTGKTSFAKTIAKYYSKELMSVNTSEDDSHRDRLRNIYAALNVADRDRSLVLIDEADEVLNDSPSLFLDSRTSKSWINNVLETHEKKAIWITNSTSRIHPSTMRRFSFIMEFKKVTTKTRFKILKNELKRKNLEHIFNEEEIYELCKTYQVDAGGIINAVNICGGHSLQDKDIIIKMMKTVLVNHKKATSDYTLSNKKDMRNYSLEGLNTSHNLYEIISIVKQYHQQNEQRRQSISLLLYGPPGAGKTEFVYYLGDILDKEIIHKKSSDILSKWVGETEVKIASSFIQAQNSEGILFFDEADSFLYPRVYASHSWEKSFTNEILAQLDRFSGIVIFATNDIEGLDHAAIRRFHFKIEFLPLTPEGNVIFYRKLLEPLVNNGDSISEYHLKQLRSITNLTPGDFAVVKEQFIFVDPSKITHEKLIISLINEAKHKHNNKRGIGFLT